MAHSCPRLTECTDVDEKGDSKKLRHCFNCCQRANHAPVDCPYRVQRWRVHTNSKRFFEALESGEEWKPIFPGQHELKSNPSAAHATTPRSTPHASRPPPCKWILRVTGPHEWGDAEAENCMSLTPHVESAEKRDDALLLHFGSEAELVDAINAVNGSMGVDGDGYVAARVPHDPAGDTQECVASATNSGTSTTSSGLINMAEVCDTMDKKIQFALDRNNDAMNKNFQAINVTLTKLGERQDEADRDRRDLAKKQTQQGKLMLQMFQGMKRAFPGNFDEVEEDVDVISDEGDVALCDEPEKAKTKRRVPKQGGGKTTAAKPRVFREPYPLRGRVNSDAPNTDASVATAAAATNGEPETPTTQPASSLDPKNCSMTATHSIGGCAWAIEGTGESARIGVVKIQEFLVKDDAVGALCQPFDIVANGPMPGSTSGFLTSDRLFTDKEEATTGLELFKTAKRTKSH